ncbi:MAG: betaine/proline/choline family ABC transporter ATP-binding protein, partial [Tetragenococcus halophilus]|nr:betaine/proline/choline family ABC transporter ATP-binding protein [Tetragenococcus halophilus]
TSGSVYIDDEDVAKMSKEDLREVRRTKANMVFQNFGLFPQRTILQNTEYGLEVRGVSKEERRKKAEAALDNSGLLSVKDQYPNQLSGGMQQRVGLARALANDPEVLLMDEAFSALDPLIRRDMQDDLMDLQERVQKTIIFITHDLNEALRIGDRIALMRDGEVMQIGTGEEILTHPANDFVREFTEDIDRSKVLTAENIMEPALTINAEADGPNVALQRMRKEEISMLLAVDRKRYLKGSLTAENALDARKNEKPLEDVLDKNVQKVEKDTLVTDIFNIIQNSAAPLAVVDEEDRVVGVVVRGSVIGAMTDTDTGQAAEKEAAEENTDETTESADKEEVNANA